MNLKKILYALFLLAFPYLSLGQNGDPVKDTVKSINNNPYQDSLKRHELILRDIGDSMVFGVTQTRRYQAAKKFIPDLVKALKFPGSYYYPFDSLGFMKRIEPEDHSFRILNWAIKNNDGTYRYYGAIQFKSDDKLKLIPLRCDTGTFDNNDLDTIITDNKLWIGALYYKMITNIINGKPYYTLLGWDGFNYMSNRKYVDVLSFDESGKPLFGAPIFNVNGKTQTRLIFYYAGNAEMVLRYDEDNKIITYDNLVPPNPATKGVLYDYIPDGSYDYLEFKNGKWTQKENPFEHFKTIKGDENK